MAIPTRDLPRTAATLHIPWELYREDPAYYVELRLTGYMGTQPQDNLSRVPRFICGRLRRRKNSTTL